MSSVVIAGDTSGSVTLQAPAVAGTTTHSLPATSGTVLNDATCGVCRAWVNFNGTGTVAIRASFNVSSITDNGVGLYTVNFATAMSDANYTATSGIGRAYTAQSSGRSIDLYSFTTSSLSVSPFNDQTFVTDDVPYVSVSVFR